MVKLNTVVKLAIDTQGNAVDLSRCRPALLVHQAHTPAEHALYTALWNLGGPPERQDSYRDVTIGYDKLAALVGGSSKKTIQRLTEILQRKLAIEVVGEENSRIHQGKTYRVFGLEEILRRRREAGYVWSFRNRTAVRLVKISAAENPAAPASLSTDPLANRPAGSEEAGPAPAETARAKIRRILEGDEATQKLISTCQAFDLAATDEEMLYFLEFRMNALRRGPRVPNWIENLLASVPRYFQGPSMELQRYRAERR